MIYMIKVQESVDHIASTLPYLEDTLIEHLQTNYADSIHIPAALNLVSM